MLSPKLITHTAFIIYYYCFSQLSNKLITFHSLNDVNEINEFRNIFIAVIIMSCGWFSRGLSFTGISTVVFLVTAQIIAKLIPRADYVFIKTPFIDNPLMFT